jgi:hypothetical protein
MILTDFSDVARVITAAGKVARGSSEEVSQMANRWAYSIRKIAGNLREKHQSALNRTILRIPLLIAHRAVFMSRSVSSDSSHATTPTDEHQLHDR